MDNFETGKVSLAEESTCRDVIDLGLVGSMVFEKSSSFCVANPKCLLDFGIGGI